jgi:hypothetical protein
MANLAWSRPELVVMGRGGREECVLAACKTSDWLVHGSGDGYADCEVKDYCYAECEPLMAT